MGELLSPFVTSPLPYATAFLAGLFGSVHCVGMCGGIAGAMACGLPPATRDRAFRAAPYLLGYNLGRIATYALAGAMVGWLGSVAGTYLAEYRGWVVLRFAAALFMVAIGLYVAGWWFGAARLEAIGGVVWRRLRPVGQRLLRVKHPGHAVLMGAVWGWLPCGLVYSMLVWALAAGGWREGALFMVSFGVGTAPSLLAVGLTSVAAGNVLQRSGVRRAAGAMVIGFGLLTMASTAIYQPNIGLGCHSGSL